jgi:hypothetical protein
MTPPTPIPVRERARGFDGLQPNAGLQPVESALPISPKEHRARKRMVLVGAGILLWLFAAASISGTEQAPGRALVARDPSAKVYLSPVCAFGRGDLPITSIDAARADGYKADPECYKNGGFFGASQTVLERDLASIHLYHKRVSRWRADGTWKW